MPKNPIKDVMRFKSASLKSLEDKFQGTLLDDKDLEKLDSDSKEEYFKYLDWVHKPKGRGRQ